MSTLSFIPFSAEKNRFNLFGLPSQPYSDRCRKPFLVASSKNLVRDLSVNCLSEKISTKSGSGEYLYASLPNSTRRFFNDSFERSKTRLQRLMLVFTSRSPRMSLAILLNEESVAEANPMSRELKALEVAIRLVITVAGLGTRLLPAIKEQTKEMPLIFAQGADGQHRLLQFVSENGLCRTERDR